MTILISKVRTISTQRDKMVVVTNKPVEPETKVKCKPEEPENVVRITDNPLSAKPYMKVEPPPVPIRDDNEAQRRLAEALESGDGREACRCTEYLTQSIDGMTLDRVADHYRKLEPYTHEGSLAPSAPPIGVDEDMEHMMPLGNPDQKLNDHLLTFVNRCLDRFDANANTFLTLPILPSLTNEQLLSIVTRDTFAVTNELLVYCACVHWAQFQPQYNPTAPRLGTILKELKYAPRYGLLTLEQFRQTSVDGVTGIKRGGVLSVAEYKECKKYIRDKARGRKVEEELKCKMSMRRRMGANQRLSVSSERTKLEKCLMYTLICFTAVFD